MQVLLRERFPDVLDDVLAAGGTTLPTTADLGDPQPGDEDLRVIIVRRSTLEWVLRRAALAEPLVELRTGTAVAGLVGEAGVVSGVRLADGTLLEGDLVVASTGRRGDVPGWLRPLGVEITEEVHESGLMYLTRWYRLPPGFDVLSLDPKLGGDLGFVKYLGVPGDGGTLSITLALRPDDRELRVALSDPEGFERACRLLPGPNQFFAGPDLEPLGPVRPMGGLLNRIRRFTADGGAPLVRGFSAIGDAHTCTNPLYGRGCSLAMVMAVLLADAIAAHPGDHDARGRAYEAACREQVEPWYHASVEMDRAGADPSGGVADPASPVARLFVAAMTDPVLGRGFARLWNLLATPAALAADPEYLARVAEVLAHPGDYPIPPREGPSREELLRQLDAEAVGA
jgi:2-polyprenyl-6-methoxyphenol hydroxylase-like FAD-dependent oxidoreductase